MLAAAIAAIAALLLTRGGCGGTDGGGRGGNAAGAAASPSAAAVRTAALAGVEVHRGEAARLTYRIDAPAGTTWQVTLEVLAPTASVREAIASAAPAGRSAS